MDCASDVLRRVRPDMDVGSFRVRPVRDTIGLHTAALGPVPGDRQYRATQFLQQMAR